MTTRDVRRTKKWDGSVELLVRVHGLLRRDQTHVLQPHDFDAGVFRLHKVGQLGVHRWRYALVEARHTCVRGGFRIRWPFLLTRTCWRCLLLRGNETGIVHLVIGVVLDGSNSNIPQSFFISLTYVPSRCATLLFFLRPGESVRGIFCGEETRMDCVTQCYREMKRIFLSCMVALDRCDTEISSSGSILITIL